MSNEGTNLEELCCPYGLVPIILRVTKEKMKNAHTDTVFPDGISESSIHFGPSPKGVQADDGK